MKIMHYLYGLPPVRGGGLIIYALDLAFGQRVVGHDVTLLVPGASKLINRKIEIKKGKSYNSLPTYYIYNALPIPMGKGISNPSLFLDCSDISVWTDFFLNVNCDVLHVHSLMGIVPSFIEAAAKCNVKTLFTTHDYYGLCPKPDRIDYDGNICERNNWNECYKCGISAFSQGRMLLEQSSFYSLLMRYGQFHVLTEKLALYRKRGAKTGNKQTISKETMLQFSTLQTQYQKLLKAFHLIHFNSLQSMNIYQRLCPSLPDGHVYPIMTKNIADHRELRQYSNPINLGFLGGNAHYKGLSVLIQVLDNLYGNGTSFCLHLFCENEYENRDYVIEHPPYSQSQLQQIYNCFDLLIVPSLWEETFSIVVLEALSYGIPCLVSDKVGAKELIESTGGGFIYSGYHELKSRLTDIICKPYLLEKMNRNITSATIKLDFSQYVHDFMSIFYTK